jgi:hypothetical protein
VTPARRRPAGVSGGVPRFGVRARLRPARDPLRRRLRAGQDGCSPLPIRGARLPAATASSHQLGRHLADLPDVLAVKSTPGRTPAHGCRTRSSRTHVSSRVMGLFSIRAPRLACGRRVRRAALRSGSDRSAPGSGWAMTAGTRRRREALPEGTTPSSWPPLLGAYRRHGAQTGGPGKPEDDWGRPRRPVACPVAGASRPGPTSTAGSRSQPAADHTCSVPAGGMRGVIAASGAGTCGRPPSRRRRSAAVTALPALPRARAGARRGRRYWCCWCSGPGRAAVPG